MTFIDTKGYKTLAKASPLNLCLSVCYFLSLFQLFNLLLRKNWTALWQPEYQLPIFPTMTAGYQSSRRATQLFPGEISAAFHRKASSINFHLAWDQSKPRSPSTFHPFIC